MRTVLSLRQFGAIVFRAGNLTVGGGTPAVAVLQRELMRKHDWLSDEGFALSYALARITPGTNLLAFYTAIGWWLRSWRGAIVALLAGAIPCCIFTALVTAGFDRISGNHWIAAAIDGALAASVGILVAGFWLLVRPYIKRGRWIRNAAIVGASIVLSVYGGLSPVMVLLLAALSGLIGKSEEAT